MTATAATADWAGAWEAVRRIDGWLSEVEARTLYDLARQADGPIVEIGSWRGRSTAALALGSMAGGNHPVFAIDSFDGVPPLDRLTEHGDNPGWNSSSPELVRSNLDQAGVNGLVRIIPKPSLQAAQEIPPCAVLFVDGNHQCPAVLADFNAYLPKVMQRGKVLVHDCCESDPGVVDAVEKYMMSDPKRWRPLKRVDSAMLFQRQDTTTYKVMLACPGGKFLRCTLDGISQASLGAHDVFLGPGSTTGFDDMPMQWTSALNSAHMGNITHFAMLHSDVQPCPGWIDLLIDELEARDADMISTVLPIKDGCGVTSCGVGDIDDPWRAYRRFTMREIVEFPETFGIEDTPHPDRYLLHNTGCWVADLRKPIWRLADDEGCLRIYLDFPVRGKINDKGIVIHERESEDWNFSRRMAACGARTFATRKVTAQHFGYFPFGNAAPWGSYREGDEGTASKWREAVCQT